MLYLVFDTLDQCAYHGFRYLPSEMFTAANIPDEQYWEVPASWFHHESVIFISLSASELWWNREAVTSTNGIQNPTGILPLPWGQNQSIRWSWSPILQELDRETSSSDIRQTSASPLPDTWQNAGFSIIDCYNRPLVALAVYRLLTCYRYCRSNLSTVQCRQASFIALAPCVRIALSKTNDTWYLLGWLP